MSKLLTGIINNRNAMLATELDIRSNHPHCMAITSPSAIIHQIYPGFTHLRIDLLPVKVMLESVLEPVPLLDRFGSPNSANGAPDPGRPDAPPSGKTFGKGDHHRCARTQAISQVSKKTDSAGSARYIHVAGKADQDGVVIAAKCRHGRGRCIFQFRLDAMFPQFIAACFNQGRTTIESVNHESAICQSDHLSARAGGGHQYSATRREITPNRLSLPEEKAGVQVRLIRIRSRVYRISILC